MLSKTKRIQVKRLKLEFRHQRTKSASKLSALIVKIIKLHRLG